MHLDLLRELESILSSPLLQHHNPPPIFSQSYILSPAPAHQQLSKNFYNNRFCLGNYFVQKVYPSSGIHYLNAYSIALSIVLIYLSLTECIASFFSFI